VVNFKNVRVEYEVSIPITRALNRFPPPFEHSRFWGVLDKFPVTSWADSISRR
jgi:hypothetical protein